MCLIRFYQIFRGQGGQKKGENPPIRKALIYLQEKIKPLTSDTETLFMCSKMLVQAPTAGELEQQMSELMSKITKTFYKVFFMVEGYNRSFVLENVLLVNMTSWASRPARVTAASPRGRKSRRRRSTRAASR